MSIEQDSLSDHLREIGFVILGLVLALVPLALWVAWSETAFFTVLSICALATTLFIALAWLGAKPDRVSPPFADTRPPAVVSDEAIAEMHRLMPFTYHHRSLKDPRLGRIFAPLLALLRRSDNYY